MTEDDVRRLALALPGTTEAPHHERTSFRVGKIFATLLPGSGSVNLFLPEEEARAVAEESPGWVRLLHWGQRLEGVTVDLAEADADVVRELVEEAWRHRASPALAAELDARG